jgi:membrane fusion protein (multidrug efflux system)
MATMLETEETAPAAAGRAPAAPPRRGGRKPALLAVVALAVLAVLGYGTRQYLYGRAHVTTDNAQVEGHITPVLPRVGGYVSQVRVQDNQAVKAGDTLVVLDDRDLRARLAQADAELEALLAQVGSAGRAGQASAQVEVARSGAAAAAATVEQARANAGRARADLERISRLATRNIVSQQQLDATRAASQAADAALLAAQGSAQAARDQIVGAQAGLHAADARVAAARAARDQIALQLSYTRLLAPAAGVVAKRSVEPGQLVQPGQPLMTVVPTRDVWVTANLKETDIDRVAVGQPVEFTVDGYPGRSFRGRVESLSPATGAKFSLLPPDNATGNFTKVVQRIPVKVRLEGGEDAAHPLRPGMSAEVAIATGS